MTDEERIEEQIEDLEAPAAAQHDVAGGVTRCALPTCNGDSTVSVFCKDKTCSASVQDCQLQSGAIVVREA